MIGQRVGGGRYRLEELIGTGAMGAVYGGRDVDGRPVAVKVLHPRWAAVPEVVARFRREADLAGRIESEHVAPVLAAGRSPAGAYWIVYRRLLGETLEQAVRRERVLAADRAGLVVGQVLLGLSAAHAVGVLHRDIKPANVFLERREPGLRACILDFGASKHRPADGGKTSQHLTTARETLGTINYMPPEQFRAAASVDERADLYATAVVGFKLLTGGLPFLAGSRGAVLHAKSRGEALTLRAGTGAEWPRKLEGFFRTALARDREGRFASAAAMAAALRDAMESKGIPHAEALRARLAGTEDADDTVIEGDGEGTL